MNSSLQISRGYDLLKMAIEIVDLSSYKMVIFHSYVTVVYQRVLYHDWLVVWNMAFIFPYNYWECHNPN